MIAIVTSCPLATTGAAEARAYELAGTIFGAIVTGIITFWIVRRRSARE